MDSGSGKRVDEVREMLEGIADKFIEDTAQKALELMVDGMKQFERDLPEMPWDERVVLVTMGSAIAIAKRFPIPVAALISKRTAELFAAYVRDEVQVKARAASGGN